VQALYFFFSFSVILEKKKLCINFNNDVVTYHLLFDKEAQINCHS